MQLPSKFWVIPCNVKYYDIRSAFIKLNTIDWKQTKNMKSAQPGDIVFIYVGQSYKEIKYMCVINKVNKPMTTIDDKAFIIKGENYVDYGNYMELRLIKEAATQKLSLKNLQENGLKGNIQGPRSLHGKLLSFILKGLDEDTDSEQMEDDLENTLYSEGKAILKYGRKFERNSALRKKAIEVHGTTCAVCDFNFEKFYGELGRDFIEIHHLNPMFIVNQEISVNPRTDLVPVCSNCHRMIHRKKNKPLEIEELKKIILK